MIDIVLIGAGLFLVGYIVGGTRRDVRQLVDSRAHHGHAYSSGEMPLRPPARAQAVRKEAKTEGVRRA